MRHWLKIGLIVLGFSGIAHAIGGGPAGVPILNSDAYQRGSQMDVDTVTVRGIMQLPHGLTSPPAYECTLATQTGRIFITTSSISGGTSIYICEGVNGWHIKSGSGGSGGGGSVAGSSGTFQFNSGGNFAGSNDLTTTGSTITITNTSVGSMTVTAQAIFQGVASTTFVNVATFSFADGVLIDMSGINNSNLGEGLVIPQGTDCSGATRAGQLCWDTDDLIFYIGNGSGVSTPLNESESLAVINSGGVVLSSPTRYANFSSAFNITAPNSSTCAIALNGSSVTLQSNTFNGISQLVKTDASGFLSNISTIAASTFTFKGAGIFPILQIQSFTLNTSSSITTTSFSRVLVGTIKPHSTASKIMVFGQGNLACSGSGVCYASLYRADTNLASSTGGFTTNTAASNNNSSMIFYDSPATTSSTEYSIRTRVNGAGVTAGLPGTDGGSFTTTAVLILVEVGQ